VVGFSRSQVSAKALERPVLVHFQVTRKPWISRFESLHSRQYFGILVVLGEHCCVASGFVLGYENPLLFAAGQLYGSAGEVVFGVFALEDLGCLDYEVCDVGDVYGGFEAG